jgi:hypothetical protein
MDVNKKKKLFLVLLEQNWVRSQWIVSKLGKKIINLVTTIILPVFPHIVH